jgi:serine protease SohB
VGASGGYWISLVAKQIFALANTSIVGSLGVLYSSFGLEDFIENHGIKRRIHTAGEKKVTLGMFSKENQEDVERLKIMLESVHNHFKHWVISQRKDKLNIDEKDLFSGEFWIASEAKKLGLIDDVAITMEDKLKELYGSNITINYIEDKKSKLANLFLLNKVNLIEESTQNAINLIKNEIKSELFNNKYKI